MPQHPRDSLNHEQRQRAAMFVALMLIGTPVVGFLLFMIFRMVDPGNTKEWLFLVAIVWFVFSDSFLEKTIKQLKSPSILRRFDGPKARKRLIETLTFSPLMAFCLVPEATTGWNLALEWFYWLAICLIFFPIWLYLLHLVGLAWKTWRASRT